MPEKIKFKWFDINKHYSDSWSFGVNLSHQDVETYIYISFFKWSISIGKLVDYGEYWLKK